MHLISICCLLVSSFLVGKVSTDASVREPGLYKPDEEICCDGEVFPRLHANKTKCCGKEPFDVTTHLCCQSHGKQAIVPVEEFDPRHASTDEVLQCCGNQTVNTKSQICCDEKPVDKIFLNTACCGSRLYDADLFECCVDGTEVTIVRRHKGHASSCCGRLRYDPVSQVCCNGEIHRNWGATACCGKESFIVGQNICCGGVIENDPFGLLSCCGNHTYDILNSICCGGIEHPDHLRNKACCGSEAYTVRTHTCCGGSIIAKTARDKSTCCGDKAFDSSKAMCCNNTIVQLPIKGLSSASLACCGQHIYDTNTELCCDAGVIHHKATYLTECCGTQAYEKGKATCCGGNVVAASEKSPSKVKCCRGKTVEVLPGYGFCC